MKLKRHVVPNYSFIGEIQDYIKFYYRLIWVEFFEDIFSCFGEHIGDDHDCLVTFRATICAVKLKNKVEFWSCDCIVKETVWNLSEKVDHLVYKYSCVLQGSGIIKMIRNLAKSWQSYKHYTQNDVYGTTRAHGEKNLPPPRFLRCFMSYLEYEGI